MKVRVRFEKDGNLRYIGHLDILRFFHKAFQRAGIDIRFSEGFHPHPVMSFASPLSVGLSSKGEYLDTEVNSWEPSDVMLTKLNAVMTDGIRVTEFRALPAGSRKKDNNAMSTVGMADYAVRLKTADCSGGTDWSALIEGFLGQPEIRIIRKTKHRNEETNIRPWIRSFTFREGKRDFLLRLSAGSESNLKPETMMEAFLQFAGMENLIVRNEDGSSFRDLWLDICRLDLLTAEGVSLGDLGTDIESPGREQTEESSGDDKGSGEGETHE